MRVLLYDADGHDREVSLEDVEVSDLGPNQLLWIDGSRDEARGLGPRLAALGISLEDRAGPGVEIFDSNYRFTLCGKNEAESPLTFFVGNSWLVTLSQPTPAYINEFVEADRGETLKGRMTATAMATAIMLRYIDSFRRELRSVEHSIDKLDETILRSREKRAPLRTLAVLRRRVAQLGRR